MSQPIYWQWRDVHEQWDVAQIQDTPFTNPHPVGYEGRTLGVVPPTDMEVIGWARRVEGSEKYSITQIFRVAEIWKEQGCYVFCLLGIPTPKGVPI